MLTSEVGTELVVGNAAMLAVGTLCVLRLLGRFSVLLICPLAVVSGRFNFVLFWRFRFFLLLAWSAGLIVRRLGCFGARLFLRRLGIILLVLRVYQRGCLREGKSERIS